MKPTQQVVNAKALVVGESGVGKTALAYRLGMSSFTTTESTHGVSLTRIPVPSNVLGDGFHAESTADLELWDLAGQPDYNVVHQLYMPGTHAALVVIDESREGALDAIPDWLRFVDARCPELHARLLVSGRIDRGGPLLEEQQVQARAAELGFKAFIRTSSKTDQGITQLRDVLLGSIDWNRLPVRSMPRRWRDLELFIQSLSNGPERVLGVDDIRRRFGSDGLSAQETLVVLQLMHQRGEIFLLRPRADTHFVLLDPTILSRYGSSVVIAARSNPDHGAVVSEAEMLRGNLDIRGFARLPVPEERVILDAVVSLLVETGACTRRDGHLQFQSQVRGPVIKCFLSHNSADKPVAEELGRRLLDKGIDVWLDKWEVLAGESLTSKIEEGIDGASAFIILMSSHSMKARWVKEELRIALQRRLQDRQFALIPILLEQCEIPAFLRDYVYVDWRSPAGEPFEFLLNSLRGTKRKPQGCLTNKDRSCAATILSGVGQARFRL